MTNNMSIKSLLREEIDSQINAIGKIEVGSDTCDKGIGGVAKLLDRYIEMEKLELEERKVSADEDRIELERKKASDEARDRKIKNRLTAGTMAITGTGMILMFILEGEGRIITSQAGRKIVDRLFRIS